MKSISIRKLEKLLRSNDRCQPVSLATVTRPDMRKRNNPLADRVCKITWVNGFINWRYARTVNRQRIREQKNDDFHAVRRAWGERIRGCPLVVHVTEADGRTWHYLEVKVERRSWRFFHTETRLELQADDVDPWLTARGRENSRQGLDREIVLRDYRLDHIAYMTLDGVGYSIAPAAKELQRFHTMTAASAVRHSPERAASPGAIVSHAEN